MWFLGPWGPLRTPSFARPRQKSRSHLKPYKSSQDHARPLIWNIAVKRTMSSIIRGWRIQRQRQIKGQKKVPEEWGDVYTGTIWGPVGTIWGPTRTIWETTGTIWGPTGTICNFCFSYNILKHSNLYICWMGEMVWAAWLVPISKTFTQRLSPG